MYVYILCVQWITKIVLIIQLTSVQGHVHIAHSVHCKLFANIYSTKKINSSIIMYFSACCSLVMAVKPRDVGAN